MTARDLCCVVANHAAFAGVGHVLGAPGAPPVADAQPDPVLRRPAGAPPAARAPPVILPELLRVSPARRRQILRREVLDNGGETRGGLQRQDLTMRRRDGRVVSRRGSQMSKDRYAGSRFKLWNLCVREARLALGFQNRFVPVRGKTADGRKLWEAAHTLRQIWIDSFAQDLPASFVESLNQPLSRVLRLGHL